MTDPTPDNRDPGEGPPSYDASKEGYAGISSGAPDEIDDLRDARAFAEMVVDTVREGLLVLDLDLRVVAANESFYRTFDVAPDETVGRLVYDLGDGQWDVPELRELLERILPHEKVFDDYEVDHDFEGLGRRVMVLNGRRLDDHQMVLLAIEDVTERQAASERAEAELSTAEARYRTLFESVDQGFCILEVLFDGDTPVDYRFLEANPAFERHTGLVDAVGRTARELVPDLEGHWVETYGRVAMTGEPARFEEGSDAMGRWFEVEAFRVGVPEERQVALLFTDVTDRRRAEVARREREERYLALFEQAPGFIAVLRGPDHRFAFTNPAYRRLVGDRPLVGRTVLEALPEVAGQGFTELLDRVYREGEPHGAVDQPVVLRRGEELERRYVDFVYQPFRESDGAVSGVIALGVDTTDRARMREELARANQELEGRVEERTAQVRELARALTLAEQAERRRIAHLLHDDLQQRLHGLSFTHALLRSHCAGPEAAELHDRAERTLSDAAALTRTLSHELAPPLLQGDDLADLLEWLADRKRELYGLDVGVEVRGEVSVPDEAVRVLLYRLLQELLFNVAKHAGTHRARVVAEWADVRGAEADGWVRVVVSDEGAGFDPAAVAGDTRVGLGLPTVRERLALVDGRLTVESAPGEGTRVTVEVPVASGEGGG